jgi:hypothetical protein
MFETTELIPAIAGTLEFLLANRTDDTILDVAYAGRPIAKIFTMSAVLSTDDSTKCPCPYNTDMSKYESDINPTADGTVSLKAKNIELVVIS